jgi:formate/nitrite transporter FocA (FNT family)
MTLTFKNFGQEAADAERRVKEKLQSEESAMLLLGVMAHVCLSLKVTLFMHGGQALVDRKRAHILNSSVLPWRLYLLDTLGH